MSTPLRIADYQDYKNYINSRKDRKKMEPLTIALGLIWLAVIIIIFFS